jgi:uncharacterized protein CbrC (UPF0167 family)
MSPDTEQASYPANGIQVSDMTKFPVSDGTIEKITCLRNSLLMEFTDWQEKSWLITFENLIAFQGISAVGAEVCDMYEEKNSPLSKEAEWLELGEAGTSYSFTSSNGGEVIFVVVAGSYSAEEA